MYMIFSAYSLSLPPPLKENFSLFLLYSLSIFFNIRKKKGIQKIREGINQSSAWDSARVCVCLTYFFFNFLFFFFLY